VFFAIFVCGAHFKIDQDNVRIGIAKAVARLMSFAQITCNLSVTEIIVRHNISLINRDCICSDC